MTKFGTHLQTLLSDDRICNLIKYSNLMQSHGGYFAEFGVFAGGSLEILTKYNPNTEILAFDSFEGLPAPSVHDVHNKGDFREVNIDKINGYFGMLYPRVRIVKGFSPGVFKFAQKSKFSFVHVDADMYESILHALDFFLPRMLTGGIMLFDDYKVDSTPGCEKAINDFFANESNLAMVSFAGELKYYEDGPSHNQYLIIRA